MTTSMASLFFIVGLCVSGAQEAPRQRSTSSTVPQSANKDRPQTSGRTLTPDDRLSVIVAALDSKLQIHSGRDCSHLVHNIYERAGFRYPYASSSDLYAGVEGFQRVAVPQPGDLIVWRGHVGIVIRPSHHVFFSFMHRGPGIDDYEAPYWKGRGHARFYRYVKNNPRVGAVHWRQSD